MKTSVGLLAAIVIVGCATVGADESTQKASPADESSQKASPEAKKTPRRILYFSARRVGGPPPEEAIHIPRPIPLLNLEFQKSDVGTVLKAISKEGDVPIFIPGDVMRMEVSYFRVVNATPEMAIVKLCQHARLFVLRETDTTFVVSRQEIQAPEDIKPNTYWQRSETDAKPIYYYRIPLAESNVARNGEAIQQDSK